MDQLEGKKEKAGRNTAGHVRPTVVLLHRNTGDKQNRPR